MLLDTIKDPEGDFAFRQMDGHNTLSELGYMMEAISPGATIICFVGLAILILWEQDFIKKTPGLNLVQGPLVAVIAGIFLNIAFTGSEDYALRADQMVSIPMAGSIAGFFGQFSLPDFSRLGEGLIWTTGLTIAVVASLETLLCVEATDKLDPQKRITPTNRELMAQGVGNFMSGMVGGLPVTQVIVRSSANIQSGGRTKLSAIVHGFLLLACVMLIPSYLNMIPLASFGSHPISSLDINWPSRPFSNKCMPWVGHNSHHLWLPF